MGEMRIQGALPHLDSVFLFPRPYTTEALSHKMKVLSSFVSISRALISACMTSLLLIVSSSVISQQFQGPP